MRRRRAGRNAFIAALCSLVLVPGSSCSNEPPDVDLPVAAPSPATSQPHPAPSSASPPSSIDRAKQARRVRANELGSIPVLMYHRVHPEAAGDYDLTPGEFRAELKRLWREGYVPVRTVDLVDGDLDVPAGKSPVVLTFDDSSSEQFGYTNNGNIDPDTAIGILLDFAAKHDAFEARASLYVNQRPFNSSDYPKMLRDLHEKGFELGNHTLEHRNLGSSSPTEVQRQLALGHKLITDVVADAEVATLSLPLGIPPQPPRLARSGKWRGIRYVHRGVLLVGSNPAPSPFARSFDPYAIPRIRSGEQHGSAPNYGSEFWLNHLRDNPEERYVSDGDMETISFPKPLGGQLDRRYGARARPY